MTAGHGMAGITIISTKYMLITSVAQQYSVDTTHMLYICICKIHRMYFFAKMHIALCDATLVAQDLKN